MDAQRSEIEVNASGSEISRIEDSYEILERIGQGGMGTVFKARHKLLGNLVAIKKLCSSANSASANSRFLIEAKAAKRLKHENVVAVNEFGVDKDGQPYAVMEYATGVSLAHLLEETRGLTAERTIEIAIQVAKGLEHAHANNIVHRDIKPSNLIVDSTKGRDRVLIVDFGIAKIIETEGHALTQTGEVFGSPLYVSPEQALGNVIDARTDIYSLGCVMFECLSGHPPFNADNAMQLAMKHIHSEVPAIASTKERPLPRGLVEVINKCLSKSPQDRYRTATDLIGALTAAKSGSFVSATRSGASVTSKVFGWSVGVTLCLFCALALFLFLNAKPSSAPSEMNNQEGKAPVASTEVGGTKAPPSPPDDTAQVDRLAARFFPKEATRKLVSDYAKLTIYKDQKEAFDLFQSGKNLEAAYRCLATVQALEHEIRRLRRVLASAKAEEEQHNIEYAIRSVEVIMYESMGLAGECFLRGKQYDQAVAQYEKAVPYFRSLVLNEGWAHPAIHKNYREYVEALRAANQGEKAAAVEADYKKLFAEAKN